MFLMLKLSFSPISRRKVPIQGTKIVITILWLCHSKLYFWIPNLEMSIIGEPNIWVYVLFGYSCSLLCVRTLRLKEKYQNKKKISLFIIQNICYGSSTQKNRLNEMVLLSTRNTYLNGWVRKYIYFYAHKISLPGSMNMSCFRLHLQKI